MTRLQAANANQYSIRILFVTLFLIVGNFELSAQRRIDFEKLKQDVRKAESEHEKIRAYVALGGSFRPAEYQKILDYADSILLIENRSSEEGEFAVAASNYLKALGNFRSQKYGPAETLFKSALNYFEGKDAEYSYQCNKYLGILYSLTNRLDSAIVLYVDLLDKVDTVVNKRAKVSIHGNLGQFYRRVGDYYQAIENFESCTRYDSSDFTILNVHRNISGMYKSMGFLDKAIEQLTSLEIDQFEDQPVKVVIYDELGFIYNEMGQYDSALLYLSKAVKLAFQTRQNQLTIRNRLTMASILQERNLMDSAEALVSSVAEVLERYNTPQLQIEWNNTNAGLQLALGYPDSTISYANRALEMAHRNKMYEEKSNSYRLLSEAYRVKNDEKKSAYYLEERAAVVDSLETHFQNKFFAEAKAKYLVAQKNAELNKTTASLSDSVFTRNLFIILSVIGLAIASGAILRFRKSKKIILEQEDTIKDLDQTLENQKVEIIKLKSKAILPLQDIIYIKSEDHYLEYFLIDKSKPEIDRNQLSHVLEQLPAKFIQVHRSHIINVDFIKVKYATKVVMLDGSEIPVSRKHKQKLTDSLSK